ncbi:MAG: hypothetical protein P4L93_00885 [Coriobacteriia bacterium]|nr:hypothetical protein [Coriobacteriia bacterium]
MTEVESHPDAPVVEDADDLQAEVERLRAENQRLMHGGGATGFWRNLLAGLSIFLGVVLVSAAISAVWLNRTIMDENRWVETMAPLARDVGIQDYVATKATDSLFGAVDIHAYVAKALQPLPAAAQFLATPITDAVQGFVKDAATKFVRSDQFPQLWDKMNRLAHKAFIASVTQTSGGLVNNQAGKVTLDVSVLVDQIKAQLTSSGLGFVNAVPTPSSSREIVLIDSPALAQASAAIQFLNTSAYVLPFAALALLVLGVALAVNRRKAVLWLGIGVVAVTLLPVEAIYFGQFPFAQAALQYAQMPQAVASTAYAIVFRNLIHAEQMFAVVGVVFVIGAMLAGPSAWATALRGGLSHGIDNIGPDWDFGSFGEWVLAHRSGMRAAGLIAAVVALVIFRVSTVWTIVWLVVAVLVWLGVVQLFGRPRPAAKASSETVTPDDAATSS